VEGRVVEEGDAADGGEEGVAGEVAEGVEGVPPGGGCAVGCARGGGEGYVGFGGVGGYGGGGGCFVYVGWIIVIVIVVHVAGMVANPGGKIFPFVLDIRQAFWQNEMNVEQIQHSQNKGGHKHAMLPQRMNVTLRFIMRARVPIVMVIHFYIAVIVV